MKENVSSLKFKFNKSISYYDENMPIKVEDAKKYEGYEEDEVKIARFLNEHEKNAYTQDEIMIGIGMASTVYTKDEKGSYWTWENAGKFALQVANRFFSKTR